MAVYTADTSTNGVQSDWRAVIVFVVVLGYGTFHVSYASGCFIHETRYLSGYVSM